MIMMSGTWLWAWRDFVSSRFWKVSQSIILSSVVIIGPQINEKQGSSESEYTLCPTAYILPKYSSLNRVKGQRLTQ